MKTFWGKYGRMFGRPLMCNFETELNPDIIEATSIWLHRKSCLPTMELGKTSLFYKWYKIKAGRHCYVTTKAQKRISSPNGLSFLSLWDCPRTLVSHSFMDIIFQICTWNIGRFKTSQEKKNTNFYSQQHFSSLFFVKYRSLSQRKSIGGYIL